MPLLMVFDAALVFWCDVTFWYSYLF